MSRRRLLIAGGSLGLAAATGSALYVATRADSPSQRAAQAGPPPDSVVTVPVKSGQLVDEVVLDGTLERAVTTELTAPTAVEGATRLVVTKVKTRAGRSVAAGEVLLEVSGRPVLVLKGSFPAFRDMKRGDTGADVRQLQEALRPRYGTPRTGTFDSRTESDVRRLYQSAGYQPVLREAEASTPAPNATAAPAAPVRRVVLPAGEVLFLPSLPAQVATLPAKVGGTADGVLATLASGAWRVAVPLDADAERALNDGRPLLSFGEGPLADAPTALLEVRKRPAVGDVPAFEEAVFSVAGMPDVKPADVQAVRITRARSLENSLIVPVSALWTGVDGSVNVYVLKNGERRQVKVTVTLSVLGEAAVTGPLAESDQVVVTSHG